MATSVNKDNNVDVGFRSVKSIIESGQIRKMYDLSKLFPTRIAKSLGLNYGRYISKLSKPETFVVEEVIRFARLIDVDYNKVMQLILLEAEINVKSSTKTNVPKKAVPKKKEKLMKVTTKIVREKK